MKTQVTDDEADSETGQGQEKEAGDLTLSAGGGEAGGVRPEASQLGDERNNGWEGRQGGSCP